MIEQFYEHPNALRHLRSGATGPHMDAYARHVAATGFTHNTSREKLRGAAHLGHWLDKQGLDLAGLDEDGLERFFAHFSGCTCVRKNKGDFKNHYPAARCFLAWAREKDVVTTSAPEPPPVPALVVQFELWMLRHRNVVTATLHDCYRLPLRRFLDAVGDDPSTWDAGGVRRFIIEQAGRTGPSCAKNVVTAVRMFLRYVAVTGRCSPNLVDATPTIAHWRLGALPAFISSEDVQRIIDAADPTTRSGRRDRAMLLLMARLGLRAGDVAALAMSDIDWEDATVAVKGKARRTCRLPLPQDVGDAILAWLENGRPRHDSDYVFLTLYAPVRPLDHSAPSAMAARAAKRAGVPVTGSHVLRHSAATTLLNQGTSLPAIGALLRHAILDTTKVYAKVDVGLLSSVARPWPTEVTP